MYALGGFGLKSTFSSVKISSLGSAQCCSGFSPGTDSELSTFGVISTPLPNTEMPLLRAQAVEVRSAEVARARNFMVTALWIYQEDDDGEVGGGEGDGSGRLRCGLSSCTHVI